MASFARRLASFPRSARFVVLPAAMPFAAATSMPAASAGKMRSWFPLAAKISSPPAARLVLVNPSPSSATWTPSTATPSACWFVVPTGPSACSATAAAFAAKIGSPPAECLVPALPSPSSATSTPFTATSAAISSMPACTSPTPARLLPFGVTAHRVSHPIRFPSTLRSDRRWESNWATPWEPTNPKPKETPQPPQAFDEILKKLNEMKLTHDEKVQLREAFFNKLYSEGSEDPKGADMKLDLVLHKQDELKKLILQGQEKKSEWGTFMFLGRKMDLSKLFTFLGLFA